VGCGKSPAPTPDDVTPGTMRVVSVAPAVAAPVEAPLIENGDFREFWAGATAPSGFHVPAGGFSEVRRTPGAPAAGGSDFAALQTWEKPDVTAGLEVRFRTEAHGLKPETLYRIEALANGDAGVLAGLGVFEADEAGNAIEIAPCAVFVAGGVGLARYIGHFVTQRGGTAVIASLLVVASRLPASITWHEWRLLEVPEDRAPAVRATLADRDVRRLQVDGQLRRIKDLVNARQGYAAWREQVVPFRQGLQETLDLLKDAGSDIMLGEDGYLFSRFDTLYLLERELVYQKEGTYFDACAGIVDLDRVLSNRGIDLILVAVPARGEMYPDKLVPGTAPDLDVTPQLAKLMQTLSEMDVEVLDLGGVFREQREQDDTIYFRTETRCSNAAVRHMARALAPRLERYAFLRDPAAPRPEYQTVGRNVSWRGALLGGLDTEQQADFVDEVEAVVAVRDATGQPFTPPPDSPILLAGDVARLFEEDAASLTAHLSKELRFPVSVLPVEEPGPGIPKKLAEQGVAYLEGRRVLVWFVPANYLRSSTAYAWERASLP